MTALAGVRALIRDIPLENISSLAVGRLGDPTVIPLWFGEGDLAAPPFVAEAMQAAIAAGHVFYAHQNGVPPLRETLAAYLSGLGARPVGPERITVTQSGMDSILKALMLSCGPGDNMIAVDPVWPNAGGAARLIGAEVRQARMDFGQGGWTLDPDRVAAAMDERTRAVFFASPGNPTGAMIPMDVQAALLAACRKRGVWLIADEVYNRLAFGRDAAPTVLDIADPEDRLIVVNSFSKSWAMTGWRLGWMVHPPSLGPTLAMMTQYSTSGVTTFLQHGGVAAIREGEPFVAAMRAYCEAGMGVVCDALERLPRVRLGPRPQAGMYAFFEIDGLPDSRAACAELLARTGVGLAPGAFFGPGAETFLRACVCRDPVVLAEAMARLSSALA
jgi:aspartate/methionine/tyrosine aminotransferase